MQTIISIHPRIKPLRILVIVALVALLMPWIGSQPAHAAGKTFSVNSTLDEPDSITDGNCVSTPSGVCTLRAAIQEANTWPGDDIVILQPNKTYLLTRAGGGDDSANLGDLDIVQNLTINVAGGGSAVVDGNGDVTYDRVFEIFSNISVTISGLTIKNGKPARDGGGIYNAGALTLNKSTVSGNTANYSNGGPFFRGGGIYNIGTLGLTNSTISGNTTNGGWGGGIYNAGTMTLTNSTISGNHASGFGGGLYVVGGTVQLYNATIAYNRADSDSSGNGDGGGIFNSSGGTVSFKNTLIAGNKRGLVFGADDDCVGTLTSADYNLIETTAGCAFNGTTTHNKTGVNPQLGALQNNGGPTFTHALSVGSAAIDAGNPLGCKGPLPYNLTLTADQRGQPRPTGAACDIGAYEAAAASQNPIPSITSLSPNTAMVGGPAFTLTINGANFVSGATVRWNGANRTTAFGNSTQLTAQIAAADIAQVGSVSVTVYNPAPGGGASNTASFTINKQNQTINFAPLPNKTVGDPPFPVSATASSGLNVTFTASGKCSVNGTIVTLSGQAGSCTITAHQAGNATYNPAADVARTFQIQAPAKQNQTITFNPLPNKTVGDPPFAVSASASSGLAVTFTASGKCSVNGTTVTLSGQAGSCTITAHQAGNATYNPAPDVVHTFQISTSGGGGASSYTVYLPLIVKAPPLAPAPSLANGDFERGATGWTVSSTFNRNVIRTTFVGSVVPHSGTYAAWLGGRYNETTAIQQQVTITGGAPYLAYWHWIASIDVCNHDRGSVRVNGAIVQSYDLCWSTSTHGWVKHVVNLSAYAGQSVTLRIQASADATLNSNLFIDDVGFQSTPSGAGQVQSLVSDDSAQALSETGDE